MKYSGSEVFGTTEVRADEYVLLAKAFREDGMSADEIHAHIECIDDMLHIMELKSIANIQRRTRSGKLRKNIGLKHMLDGRINQLIEDLK